MKTKEIVLIDESATVEFGAKLASSLSETGVRTIYLSGDLGAGKTTLTRGFLHYLGHKGAVRSPTYTLIETYHLSRGKLHHLDLYRLADPEELEFLGIRELFDGEDIFLIEWPEKGETWLPAADIHISLFYKDKGRLAKIDYGN